MQLYKKEKLTNVLLIILISAMVSFLILVFFARDKTVTQTNTQTVTINEEETPKININEATKEELKQLPSVGDKTAEKIISNRPYTSIYQLVNVESIGDKTFKTLERRITIE